MRCHRRALICFAVALLAGTFTVRSAASREANVVPLATRPIIASKTSRIAQSRTSTTTSGVDKWALWSVGTQLRGANIYQRRVYEELDGTEFMGAGPVGPPYTPEDFDRLAALGANYVNISHPGFFGEDPPYALDLTIQSNLDNLLAMIAQADMFAVISFRTGPGRSEFTFFHGDDDSWFDESYYNDLVWKRQGAQDAWVAMWRYAAERYRHNPIVVGYDLMVEPNSNDMWLDIWEPDEFYPAYANTLYDWNQLYPRISTAIREIDTNTPILIGGLSYSAVEWLPYLEPTGDPRTVYTAHQYAPFVYTHQESDEIEYTYPGEFDTDWDGIDDDFDQAWIDDLLTTMDTFAATHNVPVAVNEFGVVRWVPGAAEFMDDQMDLFEQRGMNYALWLWEVSWRPYAREVDAFNFRHGPNPGRHRDVVSSDLMDVISEHWGRNTARPSTMPGHTLQLHSGLNMVSLPLCPDDPSIETVLSEIADDLAGVWAYYASDSQDPWKLYDPEGAANDLAILDCQHGYWFEMTADASLEVNGSAYLSTTIPLREGWNFVGYPVLVACDAGAALGDIADKVVVVWHYRAQDGSDPWKKYIPGAPAWASDLARFTPGEGYWLLVTEDCAWTLPSGPPPSLSTVNDFLYQLQDLGLDAAGQTAYDLVVMDYSADGGEEAEYTAAEIATLKNSPGGEKIVLAYMSIGEAEDYRFYWKSHWKPGKPVWLDEENPDWEGNYKVRYWKPAWQSIIMNYTDRLLDAGFDGVYLDIIDAYEYYAEGGRGTAAQEMADFVAAIAAHARARDPDFYMIVQNAAELEDLVPGYVAIVDGIGQEDIYYGYSGDNKRTPSGVTAELESHLDVFKNAGKLVLTIDYATMPSRVDDAYARSLAKGYVPFVTVRDLDRLTINPGHEPD